MKLYQFLTEEKNENDFIDEELKNISNDIRNPVIDVPDTIRHDPALDNELLDKLTSRPFSYMLNYKHDVDSKLNPIELLKTPAGELKKIRDNYIRKMNVNSVLYQDDNDDIINDLIEFLNFLIIEKNKNKAKESIIEK